MILAMLMLQAAAPVLKLLPSERCAPADGEIVVCGRDRSDRYRLRAGDRAEGGDEPMLPKAEMRVFGNGVLAIEGEQVTGPQGAVGNRAMIRLKLKF